MAYGALPFLGVLYERLAIITEFEMINTKCVYHIDMSTITHLPRMFLLQDILWEYWIEPVVWNSLVS